MDDVFQLLCRDMSKLLLNLCRRKKDKSSKVKVKKETLYLLLYYIFCVLIGPCFIFFFTLGSFLKNMESISVVKGENMKHSPLIVLSSKKRLLCE